MAKTEPLSFSFPNLDDLPGTAVVSVGRSTMSTVLSPATSLISEFLRYTSVCLEPYFITLSSSVLSTDSASLLGTPAA